MGNREGRGARCLAVGLVLVAAGALVPPSEAGTRVYCIGNDGMTADGTDWSWEIRNKPDEDKSCGDTVVAVAGDTMAQLATKWVASIEAQCTGPAPNFAVDAVETRVLTTTEISASCPTGFRDAGFQVASADDPVHYVGDENGSVPTNQTCDCEKNDVTMCEPGLGENEFGKIPSSGGYCNFNPDVTEGALASVPGFGSRAYIALVLLVLLIGGAVLRFVRY